MTAADRLPAVIAAMVEVATHGTRGAADTLAPDHDLAAALSGAVDLTEVAPLLPLSGADHQRAAGLLRVVSGGQPAEPLADTDRVLACRVAARLASSAALLVALDANAFAGMAGLLWRAAERLCDLDDREARAVTRRQTRALAAWANYVNNGTLDTADMDPGAIARAAEAAIYLTERNSPGGYRPPLLAEQHAKPATTKDPSDLHPESAIITTMTDLMVSPEAIDEVLMADAEAERKRLTAPSAHLTAADKRARDAGQECVRLNNELDKARKALAVAEHAASVYLEERDRFAVAAHSAEKGGLAIHRASGEREVIPLTDEGMADVRLEPGDRVVGAVRGQER